MKLTARNGGTRLKEFFFDTVSKFRLDINTYKHRYSAYDSLEG